MGARWKAEDVYWRTSAQNAELRGVRQDKVRGIVANFAEQSGIYVLYANFVPIYVGQANKTLWARLHMHMFKDDLAERWDRFTWLGFRKVIGGASPKLSDPDSVFHISPKQLLDHFEAALIHAFEPPMNGQEGRFGKGVVRYKQVRDERLGPSDRNLLECMAEQGDVLPQGKKITKTGWKDV
ncbi:MAG TPA: hypothetical protein PLI95_10910 [Polyangiaceae bacterium]|nr:hypothetical protein [Polyangiaceae bacterium]